MKQSSNHALSIRGLAVLLLLLCAGELRSMTITFTTRPTVQSGIPAIVDVGQMYHYDADAICGDGSAIRYTLGYGPAGMMVNMQTGEIQWQATTPGTYVVGIRAQSANDPSQVSMQEWSLLVNSPFGVTISVNPLAFTAVCEGGTINVGYTASGEFAVGNSFILQLSDANGSFDDFLNIGSVSSTTSGTITAKLPAGLPVGVNYRVRIMSSNPVFVGNDNGSSFEIVPFPIASFGITSHQEVVNFGTLVQVGSAVSVVDSSGGGATYMWDFGQGAVPATSDQRNPGPVTYTTEGIKTITQTVTSVVGCSSTTKQSVKVISTEARIPAKTAISLNGDSLVLNDTGYQFQTLWICPGGIYTANELEHKRIYVEAGGSLFINGSSRGSMIFLKSGASLKTGGGAIAIHEPGASIQTNDERNFHRIPVTSLVFDYTDAPIGGCPSLAPYTKRINDDMGRIIGTQASADSDREFWIGNGGVLEASGNNNTYIADAGAQIIATGNNCTIYLQDGSSFEARGSGGHRIFHELGANIVSEGNNSGLFPSSEITYIHQGNVVSSVRAEASIILDDDITVLPNPATSAVTLRHDRAGYTVRNVEIHDALGRAVYAQDMILHAGETGTLGVDNLAPGVYYVRAHGDGGMLVKKLVVR